LAGGATLSAAAITSRERLSTGGDAEICQLGRRGRTSVQPATGANLFCAVSQCARKGIAAPGDTAALVQQDAARESLLATTRWCSKFD